MKTGFLVNLLLVIFTFVAKTYGAGLTWQLGKKSIQPDEFFSVEIVSTQMNYAGTGVGGNPFPVMKINAMLSPDHKTLTFVSGSDQLSLDLTNPEGVKRLKEVLVKNEAWAQESNVFNIKGGQTWVSGSGKTYNVEATRDELTSLRRDMNYDTFVICGLRLTDELSGKSAVIRNCGAYIFALDTMQQMLKNHEEALIGRESNMAQQEQSKEIMRAAKVAAARSESVQRLKEAEAAERSMLRDAEMQDEILKVQKEEQRAISRMKQLVNSEKARLVAQFLATPDGIALEERIKSLSTATKQKRYEETQYVRDLEKTYLKLHTTIGRTRDEELARRAALSAWLNASKDHQDSQELAKMRYELSDLLAQFQEKAGCPFDEAMSAYQEVLDSAGNAKKNE